MAQMREPFALDQYLLQLQIANNAQSQTKKEGDMQRFLDITDVISQMFLEDTQVDRAGTEAISASLQRQKRAIIGYAKDVAFYKEKIREYLKARDLVGEWYPQWYESQEDAIFHEVWGLAGMSAWCYDTKEEYKRSSSAKIIGDHIYYYLDGKMQLQPQTISAQRRQQLKRALLLQTPEEREGVGEHEVYMKNGIRITIFTDHLVKKEGGDTIDIFVFRKYILPTYSLHQQVVMNTIPQGAEELLRAMVKVGFNVNFTGAVRSGKTTMMACYQLEEDPALEGLMIETDPELPLHRLMPDAPIVQVLADDEQLETIIKPLLRADPEYIIMAEARDAVAFNVALDITDRGTRRSKLTTHFSSARDLPIAMAKKIVERYGGSQFDVACKIARNIHYVIEMVSLPQKGNQKRLKGIYELRYDALEDQISCHQICRYDFPTDSWQWHNTVGRDKAEIGQEENWNAFLEFQEILGRLETENPIQGETAYYPQFRSRG